MEVSDLVHRFLGSIGRPKEAEFYLSLFRSDSSATFAVLAVSDSVVREGAGSLVADLTFLSQLGLRPVVVLGVAGGSAATKLATTLVERLGSVSARHCKASEAADLSRAGELAIVSLDGPGEDASARFAHLGDLVRTLGSRKLVFLGRRSGIQRSDGRVESLISLRDDFAELILEGELSHTQRVLLIEVQKLFQGIDHRLTVSVTSPLDLLRELFTIKGAGSLIRRGSIVEQFSDFSRIDTARLRALIEEAFGKTSAPDLFERAVTSIYLEREYRGAALVSPAPVGSYLSKFAVDAQARGEGLGSDLWRALTTHHPRLLWRSRPDNSIAPWYAQVCHGLCKSDDWHVFWRGLEPTEIAPAVAFALSAPVDLE